MTTKEHYIELFRKNGFNCIPLQRYHKSELETKKADWRFDSRNTKLNQPIKKNENYGVVPTIDGKNCILDLDDKERFREFAEGMIKNGHMVIESGNGWHIPVIGLKNFTTKQRLFDYNVSKIKPLVEIQGVDQFVVGVGSTIYHKKLEKEITYINQGSEKIWDAKGKDFHYFVDQMCIKLKVESIKADYPSHHNSLRKRFVEGKPPNEGSSNDYFFNAALWCNSNKLSEHEATERIEIIFEAWTPKTRDWSNIQRKIRDVYERDLKIEKGRPKGSGGIDRTEIANSIQSKKSLYSDSQSGDIFEDKNGFLEKINKTLGKEIYADFPEMESADYVQILFKLVQGSRDIPPTNKELMVFKNGKRNSITLEIDESDELADSGFKDYNYLPKTKKNEPTKFLEIMFGNTPKHEHPRIKAGLKAILSNHLDSRISVIHGESGVGKSTPLTILARVLGTDYALTIELDQLLTDKFIKAKIKGKILIVLQDMPQNYRDYPQIKSLTGEELKSERGFNQDLSESFENKIKIWASCNYLAKIPDNEKNAMYERRLSLIHNTRIIPHKENPLLSEQVAKDEGEKIVSWIFNLSAKECQYEDRQTVKKEWENLSSPEIEYIDKFWKIKTTTTDSEISVMTVKRDFEGKYLIEKKLKEFTGFLEEQGFIIRKNVITNIEAITQPKSRGVLA